MTRTVPALAVFLRSFPSILPVSKARRFIRRRYDLFVELDGEIVRLEASRTGLSGSMPMKGDPDMRDDQERFSNEFA